MPDDEWQKCLLADPHRGRMPSVPTLDGGSLQAYVPGVMAQPRRGRGRNVQDLILMVADSDGVVRQTSHMRPRDAADLAEQMRYLLHRYYPTVERPEPVDGDIEASTDWRHERARIAALTRSRPADDPELVACRRRLRARRLSNYLRAEIASDLPLTAAELDALVAILREAARGRQNDARPEATEG